MVNKTITTQVGGKFTNEDLGLFEFKKLLKRSGIQVNYPEGDGIIGEYKGIGVTFDPNSGKSFYDVELSYLTSVKESDFHCVYNKVNDKIGYLGESASIEIAYALVHNKTIVLMYEPSFSEKVPSIIQTIINKYKEKILIYRMDTMSETQLLEYVKDILEVPVQYGLNFEEELHVMRCLDTLLESYKL